MSTTQILKTTTQQSRTVVVIAYYKNGSTIERLLGALAASEVPVDVILVDDCSPDPATNYTEPFRDCLNLTVLQMPENGGNAAALNFGLREAFARDYEFIAINDGDDYSRPDRFRKEQDFLDAHPGVAIVGGNAQAICESDGRPLYKLQYPSDDAALRKYLRHNNPIVHPAIMFRGSVLREFGYYDESLDGSHDYEMVFRISRQHAIANLPDILLDYTIRKKSISVSRRREQVRKRIQIQWRYFDVLQWRAWAGIVKSCVLLPIPAGLLNRIKGLLRREAS